MGIMGPYHYDDCKVKYDGLVLRRRSLVEQLKENVRGFLGSEFQGNELKGLACIVYHLKKMYPNGGGGLYLLGYYGANTVFPPFDELDSNAAEVEMVLCDRVEQLLNLRKCRGKKREAFLQGITEILREVGLSEKSMREIYSRHPTAQPEHLSYDTNKLPLKTSWEKWSDASAGVFLFLLGLPFMFALISILFDALSSGGAACSDWDVGRSGFICR